MPTPILEAAFPVGASTSNYLTLGDTARGKLGTGTLGPSAGVFVDVTPYQMGMTVKRSVSQVDGPILRFESGQLGASLKNTDRRFDPTNTSGPYTSGGVTQVTPMRAVRLRATWAGVTYNVYRGFADDWDIGYRLPNYSTVDLSTSDALRMLARDRSAVAPVGAGELSGARINRILDSINWPVTDRIIAAGASTLQATDLSGDALTEAQTVADTEAGELYVDAAGRVVFRGRLNILTDARSATSQATFGVGGLAVYDVDLTYSGEALVNRVSGTRVGGVEQVAENLASETAYFTHTYSRSDLLMQSDAEALNWANFVLYLSKDPELRVQSMEIRPRRDPTNLFPQVLGREIGDRVTVAWQPPGGGTITRDVFIRGIEHAISVDNWVTKWTFQSATRYAFLTLGHPSLGGLGSNALAY